MLDIQSKNLEHRTIAMHRRINLSIVLLVLYCSPGRAQGEIYLDPLKAVAAFPSAVRDQRFNQSHSPGTYQS